VNFVTVRKQTHRSANIMLALNTASLPPALWDWWLHVGKGILSI